MRHAYALLFVTCLVSSSFATVDIDNDVVWLDFSAWDHAAASGGGQVLMDVFGDVDLTATVTGDFTLPTLRFGGGVGLVSQNAVVGSQTFDFTLSEPLRLVVRYTSTDDYEKFDLVTGDILDHTHTLGGPPMLTNIPGGQRVMGSAHFMDSMGASRGYFELGSTTTLAITHNALVIDKYEAFQIGAIVPEPATASLLISGLMLLAGNLRRRR